MSVVIVDVINFDVQIAKKEQVNIWRDMTFKWGFNFGKNVEMDDDGGRYITKSLKAECDDVITEPMH